MQVLPDVEGIADQQQHKQQPVLQCRYTNTAAFTAVELPCTRTGAWLGQPNESNLMLLGYAHT